MCLEVINDISLPEPPSVGKNIVNTIKYFAFFKVISFADFSFEIAWLKIHLEPWTEIKEKWATTYPVRRQQILQEGQEKLNRVLEDWPLFKNSYGFDLVITSFFFYLHVTLIP